MSTTPSLLVVSNEQFNLFHQIDRKIYTRLTLDLGRDPIESMQVMGFWLWLEQDLIKDLNIISRMLPITLPSINEIADETVFCLRLIEMEIVRQQDFARELHLLQKLVRKKLSVRSFYENRFDIRRGVARMINEVCGRAFQDILHSVVERRSAAPQVQVPFRVDKTAGPSGN